jgi:hypothetical protein
MLTNQKSSGPVRSEGPETDLVGNVRALATTGFQRISRVREDARMGHNPGKLNLHTTNVALTAPNSVSIASRVKSSLGIIKTGLNY